MRHVCDFLKVMHLALPFLVPHLHALFRFVDHRDDALLLADALLARVREFWFLFDRVWRCPLREGRRGLPDLRQEADDAEGRGPAGDEREGRSSLAP